ncbi:MAG: tRNA (adenosine(37)-N6)-threonylcarbamoyltransferase complex transferase subunit TsaD, partial [Candidatus Levyibacteriota bacterium]
MKILGIETSCDETAAAVVEAGKDNVSVLSNAVSSSLPFHSETGGIIPEVAAREQVKLIIPVIEKALKEGIHWKKNGIPDIDAIAITYGPGLIGSLLVGVETAKALSLA